MFGSKIKIEESQMDQIRQLSKNTGKPMTRIVQEALNSYLNRKASITSSSARKHPKTKPRGHK